MANREEIKSYPISIAIKGSKEYLGLFEFTHQFEQWRFSAKIIERLEIMTINKDNLMKIIGEMILVKKMIS